MAVTTGPRTGVTRWGAASDPFTRAQMDASHAAIEDRMATDVQGADVNARPASGVRGRWYTALDTLRMWRDTGATWVEVALKSDLTVQRPPVGAALEYPVDVPVGEGGVRGLGWNGTRYEYVLENGQDLDRTVYAALFAVLGTTYGSGSASTFRVRNRADLFGVGASGTKAVGATGGAASVAIGNQHLPAHGHTASSGSAGGHSHTLGTAGAHNHAGSTGFNATGPNQHGHGANQVYPTGVTGSGSVAGPTIGVDDSHNHGIGVDGAHVHSVSTDGAHTHTVTVNPTAAGNTPLPTMPPWMATHFIVKT